MHVLYFSRDYTPHDHRFLTSLVGAGIDTTFLRLERGARQVEDRPLPPQVLLASWRGGRIPFRWRDAPGLAVSLRQVIAAVKPDIIHAGPVQTCAFLASLSGFKPLVTMSWGSDLLKDANRNVWLRLVTRWTLRRTAVLVGDCRAVQQKAAEFGFSPSRVTLFPWGVDLDRFQPLTGERPLRQRLGWQDSFVLLCLRSWEPIYGVDVALRGFALAARQEPRLRLILLGGGSQAGLIHQVIEENELRDRVYLGGQVRQADLPGYYQESDLYLSASHSDGTSVSLLEALACGKPVLVSDIPGNREWITQGQEGWFFPDGSVDSLADAILRAVHSPERLPGMSLAARRLAESRADWQKNFQRLLAAYQNILPRKATPRQ
ncbi:MAG TPA: glycosyltransferase [Anaerolineaceae bacterium]